MAKKIAILVEFNYEELEVKVAAYNGGSCCAYLQVWYPMLRFREEGYETFSVGPERGKVYQSKKGYPCKADKDIDSVTAEVIPVLVHEPI